MEVLLKAYETIKSSMKEIQDVIESDEADNYDVTDSFVPFIGQFYKDSQAAIKKFDMTVGNVSVTSKKLMRKFAFGTDEHPESIEKLFKILYEFLLSLEQSKEKLIKLEKEREKINRKKQEKKDKTLHATNKMNTLQQNVEKTTCI